MHPTFVLGVLFFKLSFCKKHPTFVIWVLFTKKDNFLKNTTDQPKYSEIPLEVNTTIFFFLAGPHLSTYKIYQY